MPHDSSGLDLQEWEDIDQYCQYWDNSSSIHQRIQALHQARHHITLFLEYIPYTLYEWLPAQIAQGEDTAEFAIAFVDSQLRRANLYMNQQGLMHFDAYFKNILTDGQLLYLSDFGLALSQKFELTPIERQFLEHHKYYNKCYAPLNLLLCIFGSLLGKDQWEIQIQKHTVLEVSNQLSPSIIPLIKRYMPIACCMDEFLETLRRKSKSTPYPENELKKLFLSMNKEDQAYDKN